MITVEIQGMQALQASLGKQASQIPFAAAWADTQPGSWARDSAGHAGAAESGCRCTHCWI